MDLYFEFTNGMNEICPLYLSNFQPTIHIPISKQSALSFKSRNSDSNRASKMDSLPVEVIGNILSHLSSARDVLSASATCRKFLSAFKSHLLSLSFTSRSFPLSLSTRQLEILITQTIFQTTGGLQSLSISIDSCHEFSAAPVIAWLMYTRSSLKTLIYNARTNPNVNILERIGRQKLERLDLDHNVITGVEPSYQRFNALKCLSLRHVIISALDLNLLVKSCPKIESLTLDGLEIVTADSQSTMDLVSQTLKYFCAKSIGVDKILLEAENLETLFLNALNLDLFELIGKGTLKNLTIDDVSVTQLEMGDNSTLNLEIVDVSNFTIIWPKFYHTINRAVNLKKLRIWGVIFDEEDEIVDSEAIAVSFPNLLHLSLSYELRDGLLSYSLRGDSRLENVNVLELGWSVISEHFGPWVFGMIERCPNLKKLVIHGVLSEAKTREERQMLAAFTSFIVRLMRRYEHVDVMFEYE
ncbi:hypothetical protein LUZ60_001765 [Juncus effusus]|nr:hypothetical protein LUZ60_001765 [Juncus effusus]